MTLPAAPALQACIVACLAAHAALRAQVGASPGVRGAAESPLERLLRDCSEVCLATAQYLRSESVFLQRMCEACAAMCEECADASFAAGGLDAVVGACRECAACCRALLAVPD